MPRPRNPITFSPDTFQMEVPRPRSSAASQNEINREATSPNETRAGHKLNNSVKPFQSDERLQQADPPRGTTRRREDATELQPRKVARTSVSDKMSRTGESQDAVKSSQTAVVAAPTINASRGDDISRLEALITAQQTRIERLEQSHQVDTERLKDEIDLERTKFKRLERKLTAEEVKTKRLQEADISQRTTITHFLGRIEGQDVEILMLKQTVDRLKMMRY
ncbi:hypothetical protein FSARC_9042 [Fusarium sarcochroum]|uniref:Uncharacterized protein n=1 Tax=Fusarium sarcochroum TaxID=1208366 RepID=A0A8H4TRN9_9HYPO|nr:hypothetical protein FSARC_9042 [Fusarium sarcochroum]